MSSALPLVTLPDFETLVLDRLALNCAEITGINQVFRLPPSFALPPEKFPICYPLVGAMADSIPMESSGSGRVQSTRTYVLRLLGSPATNTLDNTTDQGAQAIIDLVPFFNRFRSYFMGHQKLETTTLGSLQYMSGQLLYLDSGVVTRPAPGGVDHFAIEINLTLTMQAQVNTFA